MPRPLSGAHLPGATPGATLCHVHSAASGQPCCHQLVSDGRGGRALGVSFGSDSNSQPDFWGRCLNPQIPPIRWGTYPPPTTTAVVRVSSRRGGNTAGLASPGRRVRSASLSDARPQACARVPPERRGRRGSVCFPDSAADRVILRVQVHTQT